jgi:hypothetical protein
VIEMQRMGQENTNQGRGDQFRVLPTPPELIDFLLGWLF